MLCSIIEAMHSNVNTIMDKQTEMYSGIGQVIQITIHSFIHSLWMKLKVEGYPHSLVLSYQKICG